MTLFGHHHARIDGHRAGFIDDQRVDVHLAQLRQRAHHLRDAQQHLLQRFHIHRRGTAPLTQGVEHARALHQPPRQELVERGQLHGPILDQLNHRAASAKGNHRAEWIVADQTNANLAPPA